MKGPSCYPHKGSIRIVCVLWPENMQVFGLGEFSCYIVDINRHLAVGKPLIPLFVVLYRSNYSNIIQLLVLSRILRIQLVNPRDYLYL